MNKWEIDTLLDIGDILLVYRTVEGEQNMIKKTIKNIASHSQWLQISLAWNITSHSTNRTCK